MGFSFPASGYDVQARRCELAAVKCSTELVQRVNVEAQGGLFKLRVLAPGQVGGGLRGPIKGLSWAAGKRLQEAIARVDFRGADVLWVDVTYPDGSGQDGVLLPSRRMVKQDQRAFSKRVRRRYPGSAVWWFYEETSKGDRLYNPHLHFIIMGIPYLPYVELQQMWGQVISRPGPICWVQRLHSPRRAARYVAGYASKSAGKPSLDHTTYRAITGCEDEWEGRYWGCEGRENVPWAVLARMAVEVGAWFHRTKRLARRTWRGINRRQWVGFTLFVEDAYQWFDAVIWEDAYG